MSEENKTYWQRLKNHPGVPYIVGWAVLGWLIAGKEDWRRGLLAVVMILVIFGPVILWTARR